MIANKYYLFLTRLGLLMLTVVMVLLSSCSSTASKNGGESDPEEYVLRYVKYIAMDQDEVSVESEMDKDAVYKIVRGRTKFYDFWCNPTRMGNLIQVLRIGSDLVVGLEEDTNVALAIRPGKKRKEDDSDDGFCL